MFERFLQTEKCLPLPLSKRRYYAEITGVIRDQNGNVVLTSLDSLGEQVVRLDWFSGFRDYKVSVVIAFTFKPTLLPLVYWEKLDVVFADGNRNNLDPANLVWKFPQGLGAETHNGFSYIPTFSRYLINKKGEVYDTVLRRFQNTQYNAGYYSYSLYPDMGKKTSLKRHRGMCLAFTDYPHNVDQLQINHINGVPGDDRLENLEWVTPSENKIHAINMGLDKSGKPVRVSDLESGHTRTFPSMTAAIREIHKLGDKFERTVSDDRTSFMCGKYFVTLVNRDHRFGVVQNLTPVLVKNLKTGKVTEYPSIVDCSQKTGLSKHKVYWRIRALKQPLCPDFLLLKKASDKSPWRQPSETELRSLENAWTNGVDVRDAVTGTITSYDTQRELCRLLKISEASMFQRLELKRQPIFLAPDGRYIQLKRQSDCSDWKIYDDPIEEYWGNTVTKKVQVKDSATGKIVEFNSAKDCADALGILTTTLNWRLKSKGQKIYPDGKQYKYRNDEESFLEADPTLQSLLIACSAHQ